MPAQFRFDQVTPGTGTAGLSRHDLVPNEIITLVATSPAPGAGITYSWEILDKRGSAATLSATTGQTVTIGPNTAIVALCGFLVELTVNDNGVITKSQRVCSVRSTNAGLRAALFPETAPDAQTLSLNDPDLSTDNALYVDRSGLGVTEQNPFGWSEWAWEVVNAIESGIGGGGPPTGPAGGDLALTYPNPRVAALYGVALDPTAAAPSTNDALVFDGTNYKPRFITGILSYRFVVGNALEGDTADMCDFLDPGDGTGVEAAIAAAAVGGGDIFVRRGSYDFVTGGVITPLSIPTDVRVHGAGVGVTIFRARMSPGVGESMAAFTIAGSSFGSPNGFGELTDCTIYVDPPGGTNAGTETAFVALSAGARARRVDVSMGAIIVGDHTLFSPIRSAFSYAAFSQLEECRVLNPVSFRWSGAAYDFISFEGGPASFSRESFYLARCQSIAPSGNINRGGDIAFYTVLGTGYMLHCVVENVRYYAFQVAGSAEGVKIVEPEVSWTAVDSVGRRAILFGDPVAGATTVLDNEVLGGRANIEGVGPSTPAVAVFAGTGIASRNKVTGFTIRGWDEAFRVDRGTGTADGNMMHGCVLDGIVSTPLNLVNTPTNTVFDNNVIV